MYVNKCARYNVLICIFMAFYGWYNRVTKVADNQYNVQSIYRVSTVYVPCLIRRKPLTCSR